jgi:hypothetical protein
MVIKYLPIYFFTHFSSPAGEVAQNEGVVKI